MTKIYKMQKNKNGGYIALIAVLIVTATTLMMAVSINLESMDEIKISLAKNQSSKAFYLANACAEESLMKLKNDLNYQGNEILTFTYGACTILPIEETENQNRLIKITGSVANYTRKIKIEVSQIFPEMEIALWQEVADF